MRLLLALALVSGAFTAVGIAGGKDNPNYTRGSVTETCVDGITGNTAGTETYEGGLELWPPNHKPDTGTLTVAATDQEDTVNVVWTATHNQYVTDAETGEAVELNGSGNTADDITPAAGDETETGTVVQEFLVRSERSGRELAGRTYTIAGTATFTDDLIADGSSSPLGTSCDFEFTIYVPHDQGIGNDPEEG